LSQLAKGLDRAFDQIKHCALQLVAMHVLTAAASIPLFITVVMHAFCCAWLFAPCAAQTQF